MRLSADQLAPSLGRKGLAPIYFISGDEPLQVLEAGDEIRRFARGQGFEERIVMDVSKTFDWRSLHDAGANLSLFSSSRLIELRMNGFKPGKEGGLALAEYAGQPPDDTVLVITSEKIDGKAQQGKWFKAVDKAGIIIQVWPVSPARLPAWVQQRIRREGKQISADAASLIAERVEGNLLAARQEVDKLCLLVDKDHIDIDDVLAVVADSTRYDVFALVVDVFSGNIDRTLRMLHSLHKEGVEPLAIFGAFMWEFRRVCSMAYQIESGQPREKVMSGYYIRDDQRKRAINRVLDRHSTERLQNLLQSAMHIDRTMKGARKGNARDALAWYLLSIAGAGLKSNLSLI